MLVAPPDAEQQSATNLGGDLDRDFQSMVELTDDLDDDVNGKADFAMRDGTAESFDMDDLEEEMASFEREYSTLLLNSRLNNKNKDAKPAPTTQQVLQQTRQKTPPPPPPPESSNAVHSTYSELCNEAPADTVHKMRMAMADIPEVSVPIGKFSCPAHVCDPDAKNPQGTPGLNDCRAYLSQKQHYNLLDMLVAQYILNGGILMRQRHGSPDEYHIEVCSSVGTGESNSSSDAKHIVKDA